jgi:hypothetical protein
VVALLEAFYFAANTSADPVAVYLSPWVSRTATFITYNLADAKPRVPTATEETLPTAGSTSGLPEEVAVCLSYRGAIPPGASPRRRGRIYLGPLGVGVMDYASTTGFSHPAPTFVSALAQAATRLISQSNSDSIAWCIRSTVPSENFVPIDAGYIDNAFDTQQRRGPKSSSRVPFA